MKPGSFEYRTPAKDIAEAKRLCNQCYGDPKVFRGKKTTFSNIVFESAIKDQKTGLFILKGKFDITTEVLP